MLRTNPPNSPGGPSSSNGVHLISASIIPSLPPVVRIWATASLAARISAKAASTKPKERLLKAVAVKPDSPSAPGIRKLVLIDRTPEWPANARAGSSTRQSHPQEED